MSTTIPEVTIHTDGGCPDGNPGPGGFAAILESGASRKAVAGGVRLTTNNRMELMAAVAALGALKRRCRVSLHSDSQYLVNAVARGWVYRWQNRDWRREGDKPVPNADLWQRLLTMLSRHEVSLHWIRGHRGIPDNEACDRLATAAARSRRLEIDAVYEAQSKAAYMALRERQRLRAIAKHKSRKAHVPATLPPPSPSKPRVRRRPRAG